MPIKRYPKRYRPFGVRFNPLDPLGLFRLLFGGGKGGGRGGSGSGGGGGGSRGGGSSGGGGARISLGSSTRFDQPVWQVASQCDEATATAASSANPGDCMTAVVNYTPSSSGAGIDSATWQINGTRRDDSSKDQDVDDGDLNDGDGQGGGTIRYATDSLNADDYNSDYSSIEVVFTVAESSGSKSISSPYSLTLQQPS